MWRQRKSWEGPTHPWQGYRIEYEKELMKIYGLKNKKEVWKARTIAKKIRAYVRYLNAKKSAGFDISEEEKKFKQRLMKYGLLNEKSDISDALNITEKEILERRLQTLVFRLGLAKSIKQARQLIVHGHIMVKDKVITSPGYLVKVDEEKEIKYNPYSPISNQEHPLRKELSKNIQNPSQ